MASLCTLSKAPTSFLLRGTWCCAGMHVRTCMLEHSEHLRLRQCIQAHMGLTVCLFCMWIWQLVCGIGVHALQGQCACVGMFVIAQACGGLCRGKLVMNQDPEYYILGTDLAGLLFRTACSLMPLQSTALTCIMPSISYRPQHLPAL